MLQALKKPKNIINIAFVLAQIVLLCFILFGNRKIEIFCFLTVCLACLHGGAFAIIKKRGFFCLVALIFTVISDVFLVLRYTHTHAYSDQAIAMTTFSVAQLAYFLSILFLTQSKTLKIIHILVRAFLSVFAVVLTLLVLKDGANYMICVTMFYFANLITNMVFSFIEFKKHGLMAIGFVFFIFCDVLIGLSIALGSIIIVPETSFLYTITFSKFNFTWLFYVTSQTLLSLYVARKLNQKYFSSEC